MSAKRLIQVISAKDQATKKKMVDMLIKEIRDCLDSTAVYMEFPSGPGRKRSLGKRDAKILELRERDKLTFGKIGVRLRLGSEGRYIAQSAYKRAVKTRDKFIDQIHPQLKEICAGLGIQSVEKDTINHPPPHP